MSVEATLNCKPNIKEANNIKKLWENREQERHWKTRIMSSKEQMKKMCYDLDENTKSSKL